MATSLAAATKFTSTWKAPEASSITLAGQKVAALVIDKDESLRIAGEEGLARELSDRGLQGVPSYRMVPKEELRDVDKARGWFERSGVQGVVALRVVSDDKRKSWSPSVWASPYYTSFWGYYGYGWGALYDPGYVRIDRVVALETLIYSVPQDKLLWAGVSQTDNPKDAASVIGDVVKAAVRELQNQGLARNVKK